jgi:hypothetical protein
MIDRNTDASIEHIAQEAVTRVVVLVLVSAKTLLVKNEFIEGFDSGSGVRSYARSRGAAQVIQQSEIMGYVDVCAFFSRNEEGCLGQID